jgi:hypothetical protein
MKFRPAGDHKRKCRISCPLKEVGSLLFLKQILDLSWTFSEATEVPLTSESRSFYVDTYFSPLGTLLWAGRTTT